MFVIVRKKKYDDLKETNDILNDQIVKSELKRRDIFNYHELNHIPYSKNLDDAVWLIQKNRDEFRCSHCRKLEFFDLDSIPAKCPNCDKNMIALRNDPDRIIDNHDKKYEELKKENDTLKLHINNMKTELDGVGESKNFYMNKYREVSDIMRKINNEISNESNKIPDKCDICGGELFYNPINHYGMCLKCGNNYSMMQFWNSLNTKEFKIPCDICKV